MITVASVVKSDAVMMGDEMRDLFTYPRTVDGWASYESVENDYSSIVDREVENDLRDFAWVNDLEYSIDIEGE